MKPETKERLTHINAALKTQLNNWQFLDDNILDTSINDISKILADHCVRHLAIENIAKLLDETITDWE